MQSFPRPQLRFRLSGFYSFVDLLFPGFSSTDSPKLQLLYSLQFHPLSESHVNILVEPHPSWLQSRLSYVPWNQTHVCYEYRLQS